jgi:hypothetical protein
LRVFFSKKKEIMIISWKINNYFLEKEKGKRKKGKGKRKRKKYLFVRRIII